MGRRPIAARLIFALGGAVVIAQALDARASGTRSIVETSHAAHVKPATDHPCCHPVAAPRLEIALPPAPAEMPCGGQHSCCLRPAPADSPKMPSTEGQQRLVTNRATAAQPLSDFGARIPADARHKAGFLPYAIFSTILRI